MLSDCHLPIRQVELADIGTAGKSTVTDILHIIVEQNGIDLCVVAERILTDALEAIVKRQHARRLCLRRIYQFIKMSFKHETIKDAETIEAVTGNFVNPRCAEEGTAGHGTKCGRQVDDRYIVQSAEGIVGYRIHTVAQGE